MPKDSPISIAAIVLPINANNFMFLAIGFKNEKPINLSFFLASPLRGARDNSFMQSKRLRSTHFHA